MQLREEGKPKGWRPPRHKVGTAQPKDCPPNQKAGTPPNQGGPVANAIRRKRRARTPQLPTTRATNALVIPRARLFLACWNWRRLREPVAPLAQWLERWPYET